MKGLRDITNSQNHLAKNFCRVRSNLSLHCDKNRNSLIELENDHDAMRRKMVLLEEASRHVGVRGNPKLLGHLNRLEELFIQHRSKEERVLFPLLQRSLGACVCEGIGLEHDGISDLMRKVSNQVSHGEKSSIPQLNLMLRGHFSREENVLFWYLNLHLSNKRHG